MASMWSKGRSGWDERDSWQYNETSSNFGWLQHIVIAGFIFLAVYGVHISDTSAGKAVDGAVRYIVNVDTDFDYVREEIAKLAPGTLDMSVLKRVQTTVVKPADPLLYMNKPVDGKLVMAFGWQLHPVLKQEFKSEGITVEAPLGTSVHAAAPGKVKLITDSARFGKTLVIENGNEIETLYGHLGELLVGQGEMVSQGQVVARVGKSGIVSSPALYFEIREKGNAIDPLTRIKGDFSTAERR